MPNPLPHPIAPALLALDPELASRIDALCAEHGDTAEDVIADLVALDRDRQEGAIDDDELARWLSRLTEEGAP